LLGAFVAAVISHKYTLWLIPIASCI